MPLKLTSRPTSLIVLRNFLSQQNMSSPNPQMHTPNTLKSLYTSVRSQSQLTQLGSDGLSALISLLGSLSLPHPRVMCVYVNKFVSHLKVEEKGRDYWLFVLSVARDKERLGMGLTNADRYWIMRAQLARIGGEISQQCEIYPKYPP
jgi:hypothetical protein